MTKAQSPDDWFDLLEPDIAPVALALRRAIQEAGPDLSIGLAWGFPCWSGNERIFSIIAHTDRCNLQLWSGNRLADEFAAQVEGTGKQLRHVKVRSIGDIDDKLKAIINKAIDLDRTAPEKVR